MGLGLVAFSACSERVGPSTAEKVASAPDKIPFDAGRCWDKVVPGELVWPDGCVGSPKTDQMCTSALVPLTDAEKIEFKAWADAGKPATPCQRAN